MIREAFTVKGMTCDHCVQAVSAELRKLPGVADVRVDLGSATATIDSATELDRAAVAAAVDEAGYELEP